MAVQAWELEPYQRAARVVCERQRDDPDERVMSDVGEVPRWLVVARSMHEQRLMTHAMQDYGPWGAT